MLSPMSESDTDDRAEAHANRVDSDDDSAAKSSDLRELSSPVLVWFAMPLWRLWLFSLVGGLVFHIYWMYRSWAAYRASWGYSKRKQWLAVHERTGFQVSPGWRAIAQVYSYPLLVAIRREARLKGIRGMGPPALWFGIQMLATSAALNNLVWLELSLFSLVFLPAQWTVNRLAESSPQGHRREPVRGLELVCVLVGAYLIWRQNTQGGHP